MKYLIALALILAAPMSVYALGNASELEYCTGVLVSDNHPDRSDPLHYDHSCVMAPKHECSQDEISKGDFTWCYYIVVDNSVPDEPAPPVTPPAPVYVEVPVYIPVQIPVPVYVPATSTPSDSVHGEPVYEQEVSLMPPSRTASTSISVTPVGASANSSNEEVAILKENNKRLQSIIDYLLGLLKWFGL